MPAALLDDRADLEPGHRSEPVSAPDPDPEPAAGGEREFVSDSDAVFYYKPISQQRVSGRPVSGARRIRAYLSSLGILIVLGGLLLAAEGASGIFILTPVLVFVADYIIAVARVDLPLYLVAASTVVVVGSVAFAMVREVAFRRERQLSGEQYALTVATTHDGLWIWDILKDEEYFSPRWGQILGYSPSDMRLGHFKNVIHPDDKDRASQALRAQLGGKIPYDLEIRLHHKDGHYVWVRAKGQAAWDKGGKAIRMAAWITEITERMRAEDALRESRGQLEAISDNSPSLIYAMDTNSVHAANATNINAIRVECTIETRRLLFIYKSFVFITT